MDNQDRRGNGLNSDLFRIQPTLLSSSFQGQVIEEEFLHSLRQGFNV